MGLLDLFRKKDKDDGTYHRDRSWGDVLESISEFDS
jgi:hypothetical protein